MLKILLICLKGGRTIITTIHQPSSRIFHMFDKLLLISEGYPIYYGKAKDAMQYFSSLRFTPEIPMNPAEFMLDLATGQVNNISFPQDVFKEQDSADSSKYVIEVRLCIIYLVCMFNLIIHHLITLPLFC